MTPKKKDGHNRGSRAGSAGEHVRNSRPWTSFCFSSEAQYPHGRGCIAFCYFDVCPSCRAQLVEVYVDRALLSTKSRILGWEYNGENGIDAFYDLAYASYILDKALLHELAHWAGASEEEARYLADELDLAAEFSIPVDPTGRIEQRNVRDEFWTPRQVVDSSPRPAIW
jgi:hypothetical protein